MIRSLAVPGILIMSNVSKSCLVCECTDDQTPLVTVQFRGIEYWICAQHIPLLIHEPGRLAGKLPGAESLKPAADLNQ